MSALDGTFDLIVANPPYMADPARRAYRDGGGALGADLSLRIVAAALDRLAPGGRLMLYTGVAIVDGVDPFRQAAEAMLGTAGWDLGATASWTPTCSARNSRAAHTLLPSASPPCP